jgi:hypothetical protein
MNTSEPIGLRKQKFCDGERGKDKDSFSTLRAPLTFELSKSQYANCIGND